MVEQWTFEIHETLPEGWASQPMIHIGGVEGNADLFVLAERAGARRRFDLRYLEVDHRGPPQAMFWCGWFVFGFGGRAILWRESEGTQVVIDLGCYFSALEPGADYLLVTSGQGIVRLDREARTVWRNDELGIDGVLIHDIADGAIRGDGEWDPPGGWRPFCVSLATGRAEEA